MSRVRRSLVLAVVFMLAGAMFAAAAQAAGEGTGAARRGGSGLFSGRGGNSLVSLLGREQVQKELKLSEEVVAKVEAVTKKLQEEMREQFAALRTIEDAAKRRAKMTELTDQMDQKAREQLRDVLSKEQLMRLFQIRMQVRGALASLNSERVAGVLKLTDEQKNKLAELQKSTAEKTSAPATDLSQEEMRQRSAELRKIRQQADEEAVGLLTAEQKEAFAKMSGEKFELQRQRGPQ